MKTFSLESHLSKRVVLLNAIIFISLTLIINITVSIWLEHELDEALEDKANVLITLMKDTPEGLDFDFADEFMPEFEATDHTEYFQLWVDQKTVFERSHSLIDNDLPMETKMQPGYAFKDLILIDGRQGRMVQVVFLPQIPEYEDRTPEKLASQKLMTLVYAREREELDLLINSIHVITVIFTIIILFLINYLVKITVRKSLSPLHVLKEQITILNADNLKERLFIKNPPFELLDVIEQVNNLLERLDKSFYREQRFSSDVAHELRTPISELRSMSEVALKWPDDVSLVKDFYNGVLESSIQMELLVSNLLALARCDVGNITLLPEEILVSETINNCWSHYQSDAKSKNVQLVCSGLDDFKIMTSMNEFVQIINNLLSNAVSYCVDNSEIEIIVMQSSEGASLIVSNITSDLEQADLSSIFDRLWRKSKSRSSSEHSGLGLSLVKAYCKLLGLKITTQLSDEKKFTVRIENLHII